MEVDEALQEYKGSGFLAYSRDITDIHKINAQHPNTEKYVDLDETHCNLDKTKQVTRTVHTLSKVAKS